MCNAHVTMSNMEFKLRLQYALTAATTSQLWFCQKSCVCCKHSSKISYHAECWTTTHYVLSQGWLIHYTVFTYYQFVPFVYESSCPWLDLITSDAVCTNSWKQFPFSKKKLDLITTTMSLICTLIFHRRCREVGSTCSFSKHTLFKY
jgi:hypothetical protein